MCNPQGQARLTRTRRTDEIDPGARVEQVVDTFYVKDMFGLKYYSKSKQRTLEKRLRKAIEEGAERATS